MKAAQGGFPKGSIRAAVARVGNLWRDDFPLRGARAAVADDRAMFKAESLRRAGATPAERATWSEYGQRCKHGEVHQPR